VVDETLAEAGNAVESEAIKMKKASALITVIIAVVVLLVALGVGFSVKKYRVHRAQAEPSEEQVQTEPKQPDPRAALPGEGARSRTSGPTVEEKAKIQGERAQMNERLKNMSEQERREFMAERSGQFEGRRRPEGQSGRRPGGMGMSDEERQKMRERYENMTEEERQAFREQMRQRVGSGRRPGQRGPARSGESLEGAPRRRIEPREPVRENPDRATEN